MKKSPRFWFWLILPFLIIGGFLIFIQLHFESLVKKIIITEVNKNLLVKASATEIKFSVWDNFPMASLNFNNVRVESPESDLHEKAAKPFIAKGNLSLSFNLMDLVSGNYTVEQIKISNALVNIFPIDSIKYNYLIWKKETEKQDSKGVTFRINKIIIEDSRLNFNDPNNKTLIDASISKSVLKGKTSGERVSLEGSLEGLAQTILTDGQNFHQIDFKWKGNYYSEQNNWGIQTDESGFLDGKIGLKGLLLNTRSGLKLDLSITSKKLSINQFKESFVSLWPKSMDPYSVAGYISSNNKIKGYLNDKQNVMVESNFTFTESSVALGKNKQGAQNLAMEGNFAGTLGQQNSYKLSINKFTAQIDKQNILGRIKWLGHRPNELNTHLEGAFDMTKLSDFIKMDSIGTLSGNVNFNLDANIPINKENNQEIHHWQILGQLQTTNLHFTNPTKTVIVSEIKGMIKMEGKNASIKDLSLNYRDSKIKINGELKNWGEFGKNANNTIFLGAIHCEKVDIDKLFTGTGKSENTGNVGWGIPFKISANITAGNINYKKLNLSSLQTKLMINDNKIIFDSLRVKGLNGQAFGNIVLQTQNNGGFECKIAGTLLQIDITELFKSFDNFDQQTLRNDHIAGKLNAGVNFNAAYNKESNIILSSIKSFADLKISNGRLKNFSPLYSLAKYISIEELNDISFSELTNTVKIENSKIEFPQMEIQSSALNLKLHGVHHFSNKIDYHFSILLSDLLNKRFKIKNKNHDEFGVFEEEEDKQNREIFIQLSGTLDNPTFTIDKGAMKKSRKEKWAEEKKSIQTLLKNGGKEIENNKKTSFEKSENMFSIEQEGEQPSAPEKTQKKKEENLSPSKRELKEKEKIQPENTRKKKKVEKNENSDDFN